MVIEKWLENTKGLTMNFFTKEWCFGDLDTKKSEDILKKYRSYIRDIQFKISFPLRVMATNLNLHDGILNKVCFSLERRVLILQGIFGDLQTKYFFLKIKYKNISDLNSDDLINVFQNQVAEILMDEIEVVSDTIFSHKIIFSSKKEIDLRFEDVEISIRNADALYYKKQVCSLEII
jgi:hypothetical protein